jgi:hypothetical protein
MTGNWVLHFVKSLPGVRDFCLRVNCHRLLAVDPAIVFMFFWTVSFECEAALVVDTCVF